MMHVYTRNKAALRQSVMQPGERKSVWELLQAVPKVGGLDPGDRMMPDLWATRQAANSSADGNGPLSSAFLPRLKNSVNFEVAQRFANHESPWTTSLHL